MVKKKFLEKKKVDYCHCIEESKTKERDNIVFHKELKIDNFFYINYNYF